MKKKLILIFILIFSMMLSANMLENFYHSNHGSVERLVFEFRDYPRYRIREDIFDVNLSFLDCGLNENVQTTEFKKQEVLSRVTFVKTDTFIGVLLASYEGYKLEHFVMESENGYKLVMDIFRYKKPPNASIAMNYAEFYEKVGFLTKAETYRIIAKNFQTQKSEPITKQPAKPVTKPIIQETAPVPEPPKPVDTAEKKQEEIIPEKVEPEPEIIQKKDTAKTTESSRYSKIKQRIPDVLYDIYKDKMLMFSIVIVVFVVLLMLVMSIVRALKKKRSASIVKLSDSFGTKEFQKVTIKRLLSNGWQVEEIAKELNLSPEEVEELGRGN